MDIHDQHQLETVAASLVVESACELRADTGELVEVWLIAADGPMVTASAPRLQVRSGMELSWRTHLNGGPVVATFVIEDAVYHSQQRARLLLRATAVREDGARRRHARRPISIPATLTAVNCDRIVDDDVVPATLVDISDPDQGVGLRTGDPRPRSGDRFRVDIHSLGAHLSTDIRVRRVTPLADGTQLGCAILADDSEVLRQVARVLARLQSAQAA